MRPNPKPAAKYLLYQMRYDHMNMSGTLTKKKAKRCAKIAVDEVLSVCWYKKDMEYWDEVKQEIEAL